MLTVGDKFPEFNLVSVIAGDVSQLDVLNAFKNVTNQDYNGQWKVVFFYPKDFTFICPTELTGFSDIYDEFKSRGTQVLGVSVDNEFVHLAWRKHNASLNYLAYPMLSDIKKELSLELGIVNDSGVSDRALFIVDPDDVIRFVMVTDVSVGRNPQEVLRVLDALQNGGLCPCAWSKGKDVIDLGNV